MIVRIETDGGSGEGDSHDAEEAHWDDDGCSHDGGSGDHDSDHDEGEGKR